MSPPDEYHDPMYLTRKFDTQRRAIDRAEAEAKARLRQELDGMLRRGREPLEHHTAEAIAWCGWIDPRTGGS